MMVFIKGVANSFIDICRIPIPITDTYNLSVGTFFVATLGIILAFKFIRGLFA